MKSPYSTFPTILILTCLTLKISATFRRSNPTNGRLLRPLKVARNFDLSPGSFSSSREQLSYPVPFDLADGMKSRRLYDDKFDSKLSIELSVGFGTQLLAEVSKRGHIGFAEIDLITSDMIQGLLSNFFSVYLSAPVMKGTGNNADSSYVSDFERFIKSCPENAFQKCEPNGPEYSQAQRVFAVLKSAPSMFATGFVAMIIGSTFSSFLAVLRSTATGELNYDSVLSSDFISYTEHILEQAVAIGLYLAVSTNIRYQVVAGVFEARIIDPLFTEIYPSPFLNRIGSFLIRTLNTFLGSALMIDYLRAIGLQSL